MVLKTVTSRNKMFLKDVEENSRSRLRELKVVASGNKEIGRKGLAEAVAFHKKPCKIVQTICMYTL